MCDIVLLLVLLKFFVGYFSRSFVHSLFIIINCTKIIKWILNNKTRIITKIIAFIFVERKALKFFLFSQKNTTTSSTISTLRDIIIMKTVVAWRDVNYLKTLIKPVRDAYYLWAVDMLWRSSRYKKSFGHAIPYVTFLRRPSNVVSWKY